jgi:hypothetical protein
VDPVPVGARLFVYVEAGPEAQPASCIQDSGPSSGRGPHGVPLPSTVTFIHNENRSVLNIIVMPVVLERC